MLQAAGGMGAFIFQIELNAVKSRQGNANQVRIGRALIVGIDFADRMFNPVLFIIVIRLSFCA